MSMLKWAEQEVEYALKDALGAGHLDAYKKFENRCIECGCDDYI